jgi:hypothetical protein
VQQMHLSQLAFTENDVLLDVNVDMPCLHTYRVRLRKWVCRGVLVLMRFVVP